MTPTHQQRGRPVLGLDYGHRRLGVAISDPDRTFAMPMRVIEVRSDAQAIDATRGLAEETGAEALIVGLPVNMNGTEGPMAIEVRAFAKALGEMVKLPVHLWDERLSTSMVERVLLDADVSRGKRKQVRDKLAAQVILQGYLDSRAAASANAAQLVNDDDA